jgi:broad specificity phosphatase PhoE
MRSSFFYINLFALIVILVAFTPYPRAFVNRVKIFANGFYYLMYSTDIFPQAPPPPRPISGKVFPKNALSTATRRVKLVFVRHGQSVWNTMTDVETTSEQVANIATALTNEVASIFVNPHLLDSSFYDAKLTEDVGVKQAEDLGRAWNSGVVRHHIFGKDEKKYRDFTLVSSNLRRAIDTTRFAFKEELFTLEDDKKKKIIIDSSLQECSCDLDANSLQDVPHTIMEHVVHEKNQLVRDFQHQLDWVSHLFHQGTKQVDGENVWDRQDKFVERVFTDEGNDKGNKKGYYYSESATVIGSSVSFYDIIKITERVIFLIKLENENSPIAVSLFLILY